MSKLKMALIIAASVAVGGIGANQLRAQDSKTPVYFIGEIDVTNLDGYTKEYAPKAVPTVKAHGGKFLVATKSFTALEGEPPTTRLIISRWDSMDQLQKWYHSPEYQAAHDIGAKYTKFRTYVAEELPPTSSLRQ